MAVAVKFATSKGITQLDYDTSRLGYDYNSAQRRLLVVGRFERVVSRLFLELDTRGVPTARRLLRMRLRRCRLVRLNEYEFDELWTTQQSARSCKNRICTRWVVVVVVPDSLHRFYGNCPTSEGLYL